MSTMGRDGKASYKIIKANGKAEDIDMSTAIEEGKRCACHISPDLLSG
jgi:hypothetical protein